LDFSPVVIYYCIYQIYLISSLYRLFNLLFTLLFNLPPHTLHSLLLMIKRQLRKIDMAAWREVGNVYLASVCFVHVDALYDETWCSLYLSFVHF